MLTLMDGRTRLNGPELHRAELHRAELHRADLHHADLFCGRRDFLRIGGGMALAGLTLPSLRAAPTASSPLTLARGAGGKAKSCILIYLLGGPPHLDMFDLKPDAPAEYRGPFRPIATS